MFWMKRKIWKSYLPSFLSWVLVVVVVAVAVGVGHSHYLISVDKMNSVNSTSSYSDHKLIFPPNIVKETCMQIKAVKKLILS